MARVLIVGCGCRGRELAGDLIATGHPVRGTTRRREGVGEIEAAGAEGVVADPDRLATLVPLLDDVTVICWLLASATGAAKQVAAVHGPRLTTMLETIVDTSVRGFVYEAAGSVDSMVLDTGTESVRAAGERHRMPVAVIEADPGDQAGWRSAATAAVGDVLAA